MHVAERISAALARRILLGAQGFGGGLPASVGTRQLGTLLSRLQLLQLDSVNVFERSHYLPVFARLGAYDKSLLDRLTFRSPRRFTEYWAHEAAIIPTEDLPLWRWKMDAYRARHHARDEFPVARRALLDWLLAYLRDHGPTRASEIEHEERERRGPWWGWDDVKLGLEYLFGWGDVVTAGRTRFERTYALPEQVLPPSVLASDPVPRADAIRELVRRSTIALGIGTIGDFRDYYRLSAADTKAAILELEEAGELMPVQVEGWRQRAWLHRDARRPRRIQGGALLSPFDPVVWDRDRAFRHWGFHYRIEVYTPAPKRVFGYYSLPILLDDELVGRIDLKSDRAEGILRVQSAWREESAEGADADPERIAELVRAAASWQGLEGITVGERGTLAADLARELA